MVMLSNRLIPDIILDIADILKSRKFYKREKGMCCISPYWEDEREDDRRALETYTAQEVKSYVLQTIGFSKLDRQGNAIIAEPRDSYLQSLVDDPLRRFERLKGVIHTPIITESGASF